MKYSVITACLNSAGTLRRSIDSVLSQKELPSDYIFIDGGSDDGTLEIIKEKNDYIKENSLSINIKIIDQKEKTGITGAWNLGLKELSSEIIFILNSDDWYEPGASREIMRYFEGNQEADIVISSAYFHDQNIKYLRNCKSFTLFPVMMPVIHPACFVKKDVYDKMGLFNEKYKISADYEFLYRCYSKGVKFCEIRKPLVNMELGGTANRNRKIARRETFEIARKYSRLPLLPDLAYISRMITGR